MIKIIDRVLGDIKTYYPDYSGQGVEVAGFVWSQGWNDMNDKDKLSEYKTNIKNLVLDIRQHFKLPKLPVVIIETGNALSSEFSSAQRALALDPKFSSTVLFVPTRKFLRPDSFSFQKI